MCHLDCHNLQIIAHFTCEKQGYMLTDRKKDQSLHMQALLKLANKSFYSWKGLEM